MGYVDKRGPVRHTRPNRAELCLMELWWEKIEENLTKANTDPSMDFRMAIMEPSMHLRRANTVPSVHFRSANTEPSVHFRRANTEPSVQFRRANTDTY